MHADPVVRRLLAARDPCAAFQMLRVRGGEDHGLMLGGERPKPRAGGEQPRQIGARDPFRPARAGVGEGGERSVVHSSLRVFGLKWVAGAPGRATLSFE